MPTGQREAERLLVRRSVPVTALAAALVLPALPAAAQDAFVGTATATGLELTVDGDGLVVGFSEAAVQSAPNEQACGADRGDACARGAGELLSGSVAEAHAPGNEGPNSAHALEVPEEFEPLLSGSLGPARAEAGAGDVLRAEGEGGAARLAVNVNEALFDEGGEAFEPVRDGLQELVDSVFGPLAEEEESGLAALVKGQLDLLVANLDTAPLATVDVSPTRSLAADEGGVTSAAALAEGARLLVAPFPEDVPELPEALIVVEVSRAEASVRSDRLDALAEADPAIVRVRVFNAETGDFETIEIAPGDEPVILAADTPLQTTIHPAAASTTAEDSGASARAAGVRIELFADPLPELVLGLALAEAAVNAEQAVEEVLAEDTTAEQVAAETVEPELPRTGADVTRAGLFLLGLGATGWYGLRRRRGT